ncbi:cytochrome c biogenesis CcdA family protein [Parafrankia sp. EUN1f]|uniref:cytochrome c biogenesis CcdA family protein n=1 Tax=Parafrankia sp. EUN1f TaxID=102897 RepID=UPI0001C462E1|nr:cytochrome c biogenesis CcdA family protein [Parafrankia sp. EUN1f]EFC82674.1 cytochrome c biogenesis protein transmembrane region [Parafrankia sp. EUN1f]
MGVVDVVSDGPLLIAAPVAVAAGLLSFLSPCVLPLVPGYLSFITGLSGEDLQRRAAPDDRAAPASTVPASTVPASTVPASTVPVPVAAGVSAAAEGSAAATVAAVDGAGSQTSVPAGTSAVAGAGRADPSRWPRWVGDIRRAGRVTAGTGLFVLGFSIVFVTYGVAFGGLGQWLKVHQVGLSQVLGAVTIVMGLGFAGVFSRMSWANREWRFHRLPSPGLLGAPALGVMFGLGWAPCIGPTLTAVLGLAATSATAERGAFLSAMYCLGLGVPFLVVGLAFRRAAGALLVVRRHARLLALAGGALLIAVGALQLTGAWTDLVDQLRPYAPGFSETPL